MQRGAWGEGGYYPCTVPPPLPHTWISVFDNASTKFLLTLPSTKCGICCEPVAGSEVSSGS